MANNKNRKRPQAQKGRNKPLNEAMLELRRSSAAQPHRSAKDYRRKGKHGGWDE